MFWKSLIVSLFLAAMTTSARTMPPIEKGVSQTMAKWRAANYSDVRYKLNLTIEKKAPTLKGSIEIFVKVRGEKLEVKGENTSQLSPLTSHIILDWRKIKGHEELSKISNVSVNGKTSKFEESNEHLIFKENIKTGENIIKLDFESPILTSGGAITRYIDKEDGAEYIYSLFVPSDASTAFPVFDQPDLKAIFQLNVFAPIEWKFISNMNGSSRRRDYDTTKLRHIFFETKPISTYLFAFAMGEFAVFDEIEYSSSKKFSILPNGEVTDSSFYKVYVRKSQAEKFKPHAEEVFRLNRESIKYLEDYFDYKFPFPKYDLVLIPEFPFGGMEHAGATFLRESSVIFPTEPTANNYISRANLIFHENAHQWFGDTVTMKWFDDLWLKEGFATFMAYKAMEKV
ncbi:MAG: M1 family aminopeptidase, partial [Aridibacter sp.]